MSYNLNYIFYYLYYRSYTNSSNVESQLKFLGNRILITFQVQNLSLKKIPKNKIPWKLFHKIKTFIEQMKEKSESKIEAQKK